MLTGINGQAIAMLKQEVGEETLIMLFDVFAEELSGYAEVLLEANVAQTQEICHALKSSARSFGADILADLAVDCEAQAKAGEDESVMHRLPQLQQTVLNMAESYRQLSQDQKLLNGLL